MTGASQKHGNEYLKTMTRHTLAWLIAVAYTTAIMVLALPLALGLAIGLDMRVSPMAGLTVVFTFLGVSMALVVWAYRRAYREVDTYISESREEVREFIRWLIEGDGND